MHMGSALCCQALLTSAAVAVEVPMRLGLFVLCGTAAWSSVGAFLIPRTSPGIKTLSKAATNSQDEKTQGLSWQESLELLIVPTTPLPQRQILLQVRMIMRSPSSPFPGSLTCFSTPCDVAWAERPLPCSRNQKGRGRSYSEQECGRLVD